MGRSDRSLTEVAFEQIKRWIVTLELEPGQRIDENRIARDLELSRTPVREALFLLVAERLVTLDRGVGFVVAGLDLPGAASLIEAHFLVAKGVTYLAAQRASPDDVEGMADAARLVEEAISRRDFLAVATANATFHRREAAGTHNRHLREIADRTIDQSQRLSYLCFGTDGRAWAGLDEHFEAVQAHHQALVTAYAEHDVATALKTTTAHHGLFRHRLQAYLALSSIDELEIDDLSELGSLAEAPGKL